MSIFGGKPRSVNWNPEMLREVRVQRKKGMDSDQWEKLVLTDYAGRRFIFTADSVGMLSNGMLRMTYIEKKPTKKRVRRCAYAQDSPHYHYNGQCSDEARD